MQSKPTSSDGKPTELADIEHPNSMEKNGHDILQGDIISAIEYTAEEEKKLVRKLDWRIIPFLWGYTVLSAVDKVIVSNAALYGMVADTGLVGQQYSWVASIFYFGYLVAEFPATWLMAKISVGKFLAMTAFGWSSTTLLLATCHNAPGLMTLRFIMGMFEAPGLAACTLITVMWYTQKEQPTRVAIWSATFASIYVGLISYGIGHTSTAIAPWRLLFLTLGSISFVFATLTFFFLPDRPEPSRFLSEREAAIAIERLKVNKTGVENKGIKWYQVREAFMDWKTWVITLFFLCMNVSNGGLNTFSAQIVSGFGFSKLNTVLLGMPTGVVQAFAAFIMTVPPRFIKNARCITAALCCLIPLACSIIIRKLPHDALGGRLAAYYCFYFFWGPYAVALSLPMANTSGHTKKLTVNAMVFTAYCIANILAPQTFRTEEAPNYESGYNSILGFECSAFALMVAYFVGVQWENRRRDRLYGTDTNPGTDDSMEDLTDWEKKHFRYVC